MTIQKFFEWIRGWFMRKEKPCGPQQEKGWFGGGLGKDDKKLLTDLKAEVQKLGGAVSELSKAVWAGKPIEVRFSWPMDNELMQIVREIQARLPGTDSVTKEQLDAALGPAVAGLGEIK